MRLSSTPEGSYVDRARLTLASIVCTAAVLAGCSTAPSAPTTSAPSAPTTTQATSQVKPECAAVTSAARTAGADLTAFIAGQGSVETVRTSAQNLATALSQAKTALGADGSRLDATSTAVQQLVTTLQAQPIDPSAVRAAGQQVLGSLGEVRAVCSGTSGSPTPSTGATAPTS